MTFRTPDSIPVLRDGRVTAAYPVPANLSSAEVWPTSIFYESYNLPAMSVPPSVGLSYGLIVNLGQPIAVEWGYEYPVHSTTFPTGGLCMGSRGEPIPAFRWSQPLTNAVVHLAPEIFPIHHNPFRLNAEMAMIDTYILKLVRLMQGELYNGAPNGPMCGESLGHELAVYLYQRYSAQPMGPVQGGLGPLRRRLILDYLDAHSCNPLTLAGLSSRTGLSVYHFSRAFKQEFGLSPHQYLLKLRIDRAKKLLLQTSCDNREISQRLGFSSASHFGRVFRRATGVTPAHFRNQQRPAFRSLR